MNPSLVQWLTVMMVLAMTATLIMLAYKKRAAIIRFGTRIMMLFDGFSFKNKQKRNRTELNITELDDVVSHGGSKITGSNVVQLLDKDKAATVSNEQSEREQINANNISVISEDDSESISEEELKKRFRLKRDLQQTIWQPSPHSTVTTLFETIPMMDGESLKPFPEGRNVCGGEIKNIDSVQRNSNETPKSTPSGISVYTAEEVSKENGNKQLSYNVENTEDGMKRDDQRSISIHDETTERRADIETRVFETVGTEKSQNNGNDDSSATVSVETTKAAEERRNAIRKLKRAILRSLAQSEFDANQLNQLVSSTMSDYESLALFSMKNDGRGEGEGSNND